MNKEIEELKRQMLASLAVPAHFILGRQSAKSTVTAYNYSLMAKPKPKLRPKLYRSLHNAYYPLMKLKNIGAELPVTRRIRMGSLL